jgi:hypothetical protein
MNIETQNDDRQRENSRAVFSTADFKLIRQAVSHYMQQPSVQQSGEGIKLAALFHRIGRVI